MAPTMPRIPRKRVDTEREIAEFPYPIMPVKPKGMKNKWEGRINYEKLREEMARRAAAQAARPATPPPRSSGTLTASPRKKRNPEDIMFIKRKPSVANPLFLDALPERTRCVSLPCQNMSPSRSPSTRRIASGPSTITGPAPELFYAKVPQVSVYPPYVDSKNPPVYSEKENVILGNEPKIGCCVSVPDAISREPLNIRFKKILVVFEWNGYEVLGPFCEEVSLAVSKFQSDPLGERLKIIKAVNKKFQEFKELVKKRRERGKMVICHPDVLAFGNGDIRVTRLTYRCDDIYQVEFAYPARPRR